MLKASQKEVVIKVLKPGVEDILTSDLNFLQISSQILEFLNPQLARTSLADIVTDIRSADIMASEMEDVCRYMKLSAGIPVDS